MEEIENPIAITKRYCNRYVPCSLSEATVTEFIKDRYRNVARPNGPFCCCGLQRDEHFEEALKNAPPNVKDREKIIEEGRRRFRRPKKFGTREWDQRVDTVVAPTDVPFDDHPHHGLLESGECEDQERSSEISAHENQSSKVSLSLEYPVYFRANISVNISANIRANSTKLDKIKCGIWKNTIYAYFY